MRACQHQMLMDKEARRTGGNSARRGTAQRGLSEGGSEPCVKARAVSSRRGWLAGVCDLKLEGLSYGGGCVSIIQMGTNVCRLNKQ